MSVENALLKSLYDMNLIKDNNITHSIFKSINNDIIVELNRENRMFMSNSEYSYLCKFTFKNNLGVILKQFIISPIDVSIILDNIYNLLECRTNEIYMQFHNTMDFSDIAIKVDLKTINNKYYQTMYLYNYIDEKLIPILSFDIIDNIIEFCDLLYYTFLIDIDQFNYQNPDEIIEK